MEAINSQVLNLIEDTRFSHNIVVLRIEEQESTGEFDGCLVINNDCSWQDVSIHLFSFDSVQAQGIVCDGLMYLTSIQNYPNQNICLHVFITPVFFDVWKREEF